MATSGKRACVLLSISSDSDLDHYYLSDWSRARAGPPVRPPADRSLSTGIKDEKTHFKSSQTDAGRLNSMTAEEAACFISFEG